MNQRRPWENAGRLDMMYNWAEENLMELTKKKFEQVNHVMINNIAVTSYKTPICINV